jgi:hypothetical protein
MLWGMITIRCAVLALAGVAAGQCTTVLYVVNDLMRVRPKDPPGSSRKAILQAARNEYAPFQIVVHGGAKGLKDVDASASTLRGKGGRVIDNRNITLYREHYVEVKTPSPLSKEGAGWYPDALLPFPTNGERRPQARFVATPFEVPPESNQPLWIDLFVPKDAAPGPYSGVVTVTAANEKPAKIPIELTVWDFSLPETPSVRSNFGMVGRSAAAGMSRAAAWYGIVPNSPEFRKLSREYAEQLAAHRLCPPIPSYLYPIIRDDGSIDPSETHVALKEWMEHFHVTGFPVQLQGKDPLGADRGRNVKYLRAIYEYLRANGWEQLAYIYVLDEPNTREAYETVRQRARFIHETQPGLKVLCTEQPTPQDPDWGTLVGSVDIWVPLWPLLDDEEAAERLGAGDELWSYTAIVQPLGSYKDLTKPPKQRITPFWELDFPLLNYRVPLWINWRYGMKGLLYWSAVFWDKAIDMWMDPLTDNKKFNLEGLLLYPGGDVGAGSFVPSMRLKQIREGMEDFEYFKLLADHGRKDTADQVVRRVARSWTDWDVDPASLYAARAEIANLIQIATSKSAHQKRRETVP